MLALTRAEVVAAAAGLAAVLIFLRRRARQASLHGPLVDRRGYHTVKHELSPRTDALQLWVADMELPVCNEIQDAIIERARHPIFGYTIQPREIWESAAAWLVKHQGWPRAPAPEAFIFSASVVSGFCSVLRATTQPGDGVVVMVPSYAPLQDVVSGSGRKLHLHSLRRQGTSVDMALDALEVLLDAERPKVVLLINPHNPSGRVWSRPELAALAAACAVRRVLVVSDEIWGDWVFRRGTFTPFAAVAAAPLTTQKAQPRCRHVTLNAPTKTFNLAGLHAAYVIIEDEDLRAKYLDYVTPGWLHYGSAFATTALLAAYQGRHGERWLDGALELVQGNLAYLTTALQAADVGVTVLPLQATYLAWVDCTQLMERCGLDDPSSLQRFFVDKVGLVLSLGSEFDPTGATDAFVRMNIACPRALVEAAVHRLRAAVPAPE